MLHPVALGAVAVLVVNDHVLKAAWPGSLTGKLSDVAGLVFFPLLLAGAAELLARRGPLRAAGAHLVVWAALLTGAVFALTKTVPAWEAGYEVAVAWLRWPLDAVLAAAGGHGVPPPRRVDLVRDPADLWTLPALALALLVERRSR